MPVERMRMRPWLEEQIDSCQIPGLKWVNRDKRIFQIPWMHAARHGWDLQKDAPLFMKWAIHTGKYQPGVDRPDPKTWKANFRCAVNSLPDIEEVKDKSIKKGTNAFRVYRMLTLSERNTKKGKKSKKEGRTKGAKADVQVDPPSPDWSQSEVQEELMHHSQEKIKEEEVSFPVVFKKEVLKECKELDSTWGTHSPVDNHVITSEQLPFVCQTIEVTTENEEQMVSSTHSYPFQISPASSYCDSDTDSLNSDTKDAGEGASGAWRRKDSSSILWVPPCALPGMATFVTAAKPNLRITSIQDPNPIISYHADKWTASYVKNSQPIVPSTTGHEMRASVIMKTSDVTSS